MKSYRNETQAGDPTTADESPLAFRRKLFTQIQNIKEIVVAEFLSSGEISERLLHSALSEAEALAWQTDYPHLVFPTLAFEKAQAAVTWTARQRDVQQDCKRALAFAA